MKRLTVFLIVLVPIAVFVTLNVAGQQPNVKHTAVAESDIIDGSKDPSKIPDDVAWWMLFQVLFDRPGLPYDARAQILLDAGLTKDQANSVIQTANVAVANVSRMEKEVQGSSVNLDPEAKGALLRQRRTDIVRNAVNDLLARSEPVAGATLRTYLDGSVKRGIKMTAPK